MSIFDMVKPVYPEDFFSIQNPNSPWVSLQFRTKNGWEEITVNPSNFFDKLSIEDEGGFHKLSLTLVDKEFTRLENIIISSISVANNAANKYVEAYDELLVKLDSENLQNLRIRFGYAETTNTEGKDIYIDSTEFNNSDYTGRTSGKTVVRSPWIYFMINGLEMNLTDFGLQAIISAFSMESTLLDQVKIMKVFCIYRNTPEGVFKFIANVYKKATNRDLIVGARDGDLPLGPMDTKGNKLAEVLIELGTNAVQSIDRPSFKTLREFINAFCGKITPKTFKTSGAVIDTDQDMSESVMQSAYSFVFVKGAEGEADKLEFYYPDPTRMERLQSTLRTYVWREYGRSIVKSLNITSNTNYAALNAPIPVVDITKGDLMIKKVATAVRETQSPSTEEAPEKYGRPYIRGPIQDLKNELIKATTGPDDFALVATAFGKSTAKNTMEALYNTAHPIVMNVIAAMNDQVFNGSITIPGDPFFLFDDKVSPMEYAIKIIVLRPGYIDDKGEYTGTSLNMSYLSGYYLVKKITHTIDINGYNTVLDIMRSPLD